MLASTLRVPKCHVTCLILVRGSLCERDFLVASNSVSQGRQSKAMPAQRAQGWGVHWVSRLNYRLIIPFFWPQTHCGWGWRPCSWCGEYSGLLQAGGLACTSAGCEFTLYLGSGDSGGNTAAESFSFTISNKKKSFYFKLGISPGTSHMLGKCCVTEPRPHRACIEDCRQSTASELYRQPFSSLPLFLPSLPSPTPPEAKTVSDCGPEPGTVPGKGMHQCV